MRSASVFISGLPEGQNIRDLDVPAGATAGDVLRSAGLDGYLLSVEGSDQRLANEEDIYNLIPKDGSLKFRATPQAEVGSGWLDRVLFLLGAPRRPVVRTGGRVLPVPARVRPTSGRGRVAVTRDARPLHEVRGWRWEGKALVGAFRTARGAAAGRISVADPRRPEFFIVNPPAGLLNGSHSACFRRRRDGTYFVHFGLANPNVDAGIAAIEELLGRALREGR